jgi:hypothetical protein
MQEDFDCPARRRYSSLPGCRIENRQGAKRARVGSVKMESSERSKKIKQWVLIFLGLAAMAWGFVMM